MWIESRTKARTMWKKRCIVLAALVAGTPTALAGPRDDVVDVLAKCTDVTDREARIECYDRAAPQLRAAAGLPVAVAPSPMAAPLAAAPSPPAPPSAPQYAPPAQAEAPPPSSSFLGSLDPFSEDTAPPPMASQMAFQPIGQEILPITIGVADYDITPAGFTVTLDNGQVWQERGRNDVPPFKGGAKNFVRLERGLIGGVDLYLKGYGHLYKVRRIK